MQKGKFGICYWFYAVAAFVLAFLGQVLLAGLLLGFVIAAERDEWTIKQTMQAFLLSLVTSVVDGVFGLFNFGIIPVIGGVINIIFGIIAGIVSLLVLICVIVGIVRTARGQDAKIPLVSTLTDRAFGIIKEKVYTNQPPAPPYPQQPQAGGPSYYYAPQPPVAPQQPAQPPVAPQQPAQPPVAPQQGGWTQNPPQA